MKREIKETHKLRKRDKIFYLNQVVVNQSYMRCKILPPENRYGVCIGECQKKGV